MRTLAHFGWGYFRSSVGHFGWGANLTAAKYENNDATKITSRPYDYIGINFFFYSSFLPCIFFFNYYSCLFFFFLNKSTLSLDYISISSPLLISSQTWPDSNLTQIRPKPDPDHKWIVHGSSLGRAESDSARVWSKLDCVVFGS